MLARVENFVIIFLAVLSSIILFLNVFLMEMKEMFHCCDNISFKFWVMQGYHIIHYSCFLSEKKVRSDNHLSVIEIVELTGFVSAFFFLQMLRDISNPRILLLQSAIEHQRVENKFSSIDPIVLQVSLLSLFQSN